jgi:hypothetical protein
MKHIFKKSILSVCALFLLNGFFTSCNDWLDVLPNNEQVTDSYWQSKEDVEAVIASGYYYLRQSVPTLIKWGELRGGAIYTSNNSESRLQDFNMTPRRRRQHLLRGHAQCPPRRGLLPARLLLLHLDEELQGGTLGDSRLR